MRKMHYKVNLLILCFLCLNIAGASVLCLSPSVAKTESNYSGTVNVTEREAEDIAQAYNDISAYSREGLVCDLVNREKMRRPVAESAVENLDIDWDKQALRAANQILHLDGYSEPMLAKALRDERYTKNEIDYAMKNCNADYVAQAKRKASQYCAMNGSGSGLEKYLEKAGFKNEEIEIAIGESD